MPSSSDDSIYSAILKSQNPSIDTTQAMKAWDDAKAVLKNQNISDNDPTYYDKLAGMTATALGDNNPTMQPKPNPSTPMAPTPTATTTSKPITAQKSMFNPQEKKKVKYKTIEEEISTEFEFVDNKDGHEKSPSEYFGMKKLDLAKKMVKDLKAKDISKGQITQALVNRLGYQQCDAEALADGKKLEIEVYDDVAPQDQSAPKEDMKERNDYEHLNLMLRDAPDKDVLAIYKSKDNFEWALSSTKYVAKATIYQINRIFQARFEVVTAWGPKWPANWKFLRPRGITNILKFSIDQLQADPNGMRISPNGNSVDYSSISGLIDTLDKLFKSYFEVWDRKNFQIIILSTDSGKQVQFLEKLCDRLCKISGLSYDDDLSAEFCDPYINISQKPTLYKIIKNSRGSKYKESANLNESMEQMQEASIDWITRHYIEGDSFIDMMKTFKTTLGPDQWILSKKTGPMKSEEISPRKALEFFIRNQPNKHINDWRFSPEDVNALVQMLNNLANGNKEPDKKVPVTMADVEEIRKIIHGERHKSGLLPPSVKPRQRYA